MKNAHVGRFPNWFGLKYPRLVNKRFGYFIYSISHIIWMTPTRLIFNAHP